MSELVAKFFAQDLSELEAGQLEAELLAAPEAALAMAAEAERRWKAFGLPEPRLRRKVDPRKALIWGSVAFAAFALLALVFGLRQDAGEGSAPESVAPDTGLSRESYEEAWEASRYSRKPKSGGTSRSRRGSRRDPGSAAPRQEPRALMPHMSATRRISQTLSGGSLKVGVAMSHKGPALVRVVDARNRVIRLLHNGVLNPGSWEFEWDGKDSQGRPAASGTYRILVSRAGRVSSQTVRLRHD